MICIFTALYPEAQPLIKAMQLKKDNEASVFQTYVGRDEETMLILTGPGPVRAAAAAGYMLCAHKDEKDITLINYGSCAAENSTEPGTLYRCCKLTSADENRTFYPDMLVQSGLPEAEIVTSGSVWKGAKPSPSTLPVLHDMEAAAIYEAGNLRLGPHRMHFLKFVSDFGEKEKITPQILRKSSEKAAGKAVEYIQALQLSGVPDTGVPVTECEKLAEDLRASVTMKAQLRQLFLYAKLSGIDTDTLVRKLCEEKKIPARDKRDGMKVLQELRRMILTED